MQESLFNSKKAILAPLASWSDLPFRQLCREQGADLCFTEMISAKGLVYENVATNELLTTNMSDKPLIVQLFGNEEYFLAKATEKLLKLNFTHFDLNMGCSVPKVIKTGAGAALLKDIDLTYTCIKTMLDLAGKNKVSIKIRLGFNNNQNVWQELLQKISNLDINFITLHPRYAKQGFTGKANWQQIAELKRLAPPHLPVLASGDIFTAKDAISCLEATKADAIMFARGALNNPFIFKDYHKLLNNIEPKAPSSKELYKLILRHIELAKEHLPRTSLLKMRTFIPRYAKNLSDAKQLRMQIIKSQSWQELEDILEDFFNQMHDKT